MAERPAPPTDETLTMHERWLTSGDLRYTLTRQQLSTLVAEVRRLRQLDRQGVRITGSLARVLSAILDRIAAGEPVEDVARDFTDERGNPPDLRQIERWLGENERLARQVAAEHRVGDGFLADVNRLRGLLRRAEYALSSSGAYLGFEQDVAAVRDAIERELAGGEGG